MGSGQRVAVLRSTLDTNRQSLRRALLATGELGLTVRNPGYGHPLRPEYLLTPRGEAIAPLARDVVRAAQRGGWSEAMAKKWSLPVLTAVHCGANRYSRVAAALPASTPRALAGALDDLIDAGLLAREIIDERPPRPIYEVTGDGRELAECGVALGEAARLRVG